MSDFKLDLENLIEKHLYKLPIGTYGPENGFPLHAFIYVIIEKKLIDKTIKEEIKNELRKYQNNYLNFNKIEDFPNHHEIIKFLNSI